jgi:hypothetical protein
VVDPARVRRPQDKPRVERMVGFVRQSFFAGEAFIDLDDAQRRAECGAASAPGCAGMARSRRGPPRCSGSRRRRCCGRRRPSLRPAGLRHRQGAPRPHIEVAKALYSVPGNPIGQHVQVRADRALVRIFARG